MSYSNANKVRFDLVYFAEFFVTKINMAVNLKYFINNAFFKTYFMKKKIFHFILFFNVRKLAIMIPEI